MSDTPRHSVSVAAAIFDDTGENVLLIKRRDNGRWEPPGGVLELHETIQDGLRREVREETGAEIEVGPLTGVYKNMPNGIVALVFRCGILGEPVAHTSEASSVAWRKIDDVQRIMSEAYAVRVLDALVPKPRVEVRHHDGYRLADGEPQSSHGPEGS